MVRIHAGTGRRSRRFLAGIGAGASVAFVWLLLSVAPLASAMSTQPAGSLGVTVKKPYTGIVYTDTQTTFSGIGCPGTGNYSFTPPYFSLAKGRGGGGIQASSEPCASWVDEYHQVDIWFGLNLTSFTAPSSVTHDHVKFHWVLSYILYVNTTWAGGSDLAYAFAEVTVGAWVYDVTTGINTGSQTAYDNLTYLDDASGTQGIEVTPNLVHVNMVVTLNLVAGDTYSLRSYVQSEARAETDGPLGSANSALAQVVWYGTGPAGNLESITY